MLRWLIGSILSGNGAKPTNDVEATIGRPATNFEDFARRNVADWNKEDEA